MRKVHAMKKFAATAVLAAAAGFAAAQPATAFDFGTITGDTGTTLSIDPNEVAWVSFSLSQAIDASVFLELTTVDLVGAGNIDTEIGLYDAAGNRIADDDDGAFSTASLLSFGSGSGRADLDENGAAAAAGQDGTLAAGTYYLAIGEFNVDFFDTNFDVESTGSDIGGEIALNIFTNVPAPSSAALLGLGGLVAARRRR